jgi:hypothetical protein
MVCVPTEYAINTVFCKLRSLVNNKSPIEHLLGVALFEALSKHFPEWRCWFHSPSDFIANSQGCRRDEFVIVPKWEIADVGQVDFAIFAPQISVREPLVVVECDGHEFHSTPDQASKDRRRDRVLLRLGVTPLRYTGRDIMRKKTEIAQEIAEFVGQNLSRY